MQRIKSWNSNLFRFESRAKKPGRQQHKNKAQQAVFSARLPVFTTVMVSVATHPAIITTQSKALQSVHTLKYQLGQLSLELNPRLEAGFSPI